MGAAQEVDDCIVIKFHSGIGSGLIIGGAVVRGPQGGAGEIGHTTVDERGPLCRCGKRGCLDSFASVPAILETLQPQHGELTLRDVMSLLADGDPGWYVWSVTRPSLSARSSPTPVTCSRPSRWASGRDDGRR